MRCVVTKEDDITRRMSSIREIDIGGERADSFRDGVNRVEVIFNCKVIMLRVVKRIRVNADRISFFFEMR